MHPIKLFLLKHARTLIFAIQDLYEKLYMELELGDDDDMTNPCATDVKTFKAARFEQDFNKWKEEIEKERGGIVEIVSRDVIDILQDKQITIYWRIRPAPRKKTK